MKANRLIGGELEASLVVTMKVCPPKIAGLLRGGIWTDSGRGALVGLLHHLRQERHARCIYVPEYICESVVRSVAVSGLELKTYPINSHLEWSAPPPQGAVLLGVHYFGFVNEPLLAANNDCTVIEDCAQALLTELPSLASTRNRYRIYSPRKFVGVPAGGCVEGMGGKLFCSGKGGAGSLWEAWAGRFLKGIYRANPNAERDQDLEELYVELMQRFERFLDRHPQPRALPVEIMQVLRHQDYETAFHRRRENCRLLLELLPRGFQPVFKELPANVCPLGMPVLVSETLDRDRIRARLKKAGIFCPVHWPKPKRITRISSEATRIYRQVLTLPVDQRLGPEDMRYLARQLRIAGRS